MEEMTEVVKIIPQERVQNRTAEQIVYLFLLSCRGKFQLLKQRTTQLWFHRLSSSTAMNIPVEQQRQLPMVQTVEKNVEVQQVQSMDMVVDMPVFPEF